MGLDLERVGQCEILFSSLDQALRTEIQKELIPLRVSTHPWLLSVFSGPLLQALEFTRISTWL